MTNTIRLKIMFFVIIYSAIDQGYIGHSLASCNKDEIWDLRAELGLTWDHFRTNFFPNRNRDFFSETKFSETETETLKDLAKVSKPRSFETEMSISAPVSSPARAT